jgi:acetyl esterase/lipase
MPEKPPNLAVLRAWMEYPVSGGPTVSADGRWVSFISNPGGLPQAWGIPIEGGTPKCLYDARENVGRVLAAPSGSNLLLTVDHGGDEHWQLCLRESSEPDASTSVRPLAQDPTRIHEPGAWRDGERFVFASNRRDLRFFDVYETNVAGGEPRLLRKEDAFVSVVAAQPERLLLNRSNTNLDVDLILVDGERETLLTPHSGELTVWSADLSDGDVIAGANPDREFAALVRYRTGGSPEVLREFDGEVEVVKCEPEGSQVAYGVNREGRSELHVFDTRSGEDRLLETPGIGTVASFAWVPGSEGFVFEYSSPTAGHEIWRCDLAARTVRPLTRSPVAMPGPTAEPSLHAFRAEDGLRVPYWEWAPRSRAARGTLIFVHGGPESQARPYFGSGLNSFFVSEGWRVIEPNVRGSSGYGRTYVHLDDVRKRMDSVRDLRDLVRTLVTEGKAKPGQIGIIGGSYGGFMVLAAITTYPDLWGAAVEFFGIANFVTFLEQTGVWRRKLREPEYGSLEHDREFLEAISPIHHVDRIVTPLLVAHGANDVRVPLVEAEQIVEALRKRKIPVEFLRYGDEGHGFMRLENQVDSWGRSADFFSRYLPSA